MKRFFVYGAGGHAMVVMDCAEICGFEIFGFIDDFSHDPGRKVFEKNVYSPDILQAGDVVFMGFGNNRMRQQTGRALQQRNIETPTLIHPAATVSRYASIGTGCYIGAQAVVDPGCEIGEFAILNKNSTVSHNSKIGAAVHMCPGAMCAGSCSIGERCFLGIGTKVIANTTLADDVYAGAGSVIVNDFLTPHTLIYGVPARDHGKSKV